jgi:hypothetical protein
MWQKPGTFGALDDSPTYQDHWMHFFNHARKKKLSKSGKQVRALGSTCEAILPFFSLSRLGARALGLGNFLNRQRQQARWATLYSLLQQ